MSRKTICGEHSSTSQCQTLSFDTGNIIANVGEESRHHCCPSVVGRQQRSARNGGVFGAGRRLQ